MFHFTIIGHIEAFSSKEKHINFFSSVAPKNTQKNGDTIHDKWTINYNYIIIIVSRGDTQRSINLSLEKFYWTFLLSVQSDGAQMNTFLVDSDKKVQK